MTPRRVFVVYAHDTPDHKEHVERFCWLLANFGTEVHLDQWDLDRRRDWQVWATTQIYQADFVLVVASPVCRRVGNGDIEPNAHLGLQSEMRMLRELYHSDADWRCRILPVVLPGGSVDDIPLFLQPRTADHFPVTSLDPAGAENLLRLVTGRLSGHGPGVGRC